MPADGVGTWQRRESPAAPVSHTAGLEVVESSASDWRVDVLTPGELPAPDRRIWFDLVRFALPELGSIRLSQLSTALREVRLESVQGERAPDGRVWLAKDLSLRAEGALRARYRLIAGPGGWSAPISTRWLNSWMPDQVRVPPPGPGSDADLAEFVELTELGELEGTATLLEMIEEGLNGTLPVVLAALDRARILGTDAAPLVHVLARQIGSQNRRVSLAAVRAVAATGASEGAAYLQWARTRA